jgi:hypothetical protein
MIADNKTLEVKFMEKAKTRLYEIRVNKAIELPDTLDTFVPTPALEWRDILIVMQVENAEEGLRLSNDYVQGKIGTWCFSTHGCPVLMQN